MGANMGKSYAYNPNYSMKRRTSSPGENNNFSKEYWGTTGGGETNGGSGNQASYWMVDNEKRYRQEVFQRNSSNFYQPSSSYQTTSSFDSPFSSHSSKAPFRSGQLSFDKPTGTSSSQITSVSSMKPSMPKYVPAIGGRV